MHEESSTSGASEESRPIVLRRHRSRKVIAILSVIAMIVELVAAQADASAATSDKDSAIQIIQLWTPHLYYLMLIIGLTVAAYIWTRATD